LKKIKTALKEPTKNDDDTLSQSPSNPNRTGVTAIAEDILFAQKSHKADGRATWAT
jgi:hypothetical protein